ncbi:MAG TPA: HAMP domain-containing sensor histidine kinase [Streptosporangiaceae bacterium]|nr:HAMP domain-containing sensor histidine kinase [Streptosporangiaceae bacterium]
MTQAGNRTGFWRSVRELPERTPLRVKLIAAVLVLVVVALTVISFVGIYVLRGNLLTQVDDQLAGESGRVVSVLGGRGGGQPEPFWGAAASWVPDKGARQQLIPATKNNGQPTAGPSIPADASSLPTSYQDAVTLGSTSGSGRWRAIGIPLTIQLNGSPASDGVLVVAVNADNAYSTLRALTELDVLVSVIIVLALLGLGTAIVRASLRPLVEIEETAAAIAAGDLSERVPERDPRTEVGRLGQSFNDMVDKLQHAFELRSRSETAARRSEEKMRQFVGDASHELRTPLTVIRGYAEQYRHRGGIVTPGSDKSSGQLTPADMDRNMRRVEEESARMGILVEDMLLLARLDQQRPLEARTVDLLTLAADAVQDARAVAPSRSINLTVGAGSALLVIGDEVRLRQVIDNLMTNALTHTPDGSPIEVLIRPGDLSEAAAATAMARPDGDDELGGEGPASLSPEAEEEASWDAEHAPPPPAPLGLAAAVLSGPAAVLEVTDHGPGLTPEQAEHVFERFYRANPARPAGGTGLGLAIVAALVSAHGGAAWVKTRPGDGATFSIALPLTPEAAAGTEDEHDEEPDLAEQRDADRAADGTGDAGSPPPWFFADEDSLRSTAPRGPR